MSMADYMGLKLRHMNSTETGGSSYVLHVLAGGSTSYTSIFFRTATLTGLVQNAQIYQIIPHPSR